MPEKNALLEDLKTFKENFCQAIKEDNFEIQIDMTQKLVIFAEHLGEELTRNELLPFIAENMDFHNEILLNLSAQLKEFIPLVGGYEHCKPVLELLKKISHTDESIVREKTVQMLKNIADDLSSELIEELLVPILDSLSNEDWFASKCSAVSLFPIIYPKVSDDKKEELRHNFRLLLQDDSPIVRKAAAVCLVDMIPILDKDSVKNEFVSVFDNISADCMDSVQINAINIAISLCRRFTETEIDELVFHTLEDFTESTSWKVRQMLALHIAEIQEAIPYPKFRGKLLAMFQKLLKDDEKEVRMLAVKNLVNYSKHFKKSYEAHGTENNFEAVFIQSIIPQIAILAVDPNTEVKLALTENILSLSNVVTKEVFIEHVMPLVVDILEEETSVLVKAAILMNLKDLSQDIDFTKSFPSIKKVIRTLIVYSQSHWRTRKGLLLAFIHISRFATKEYFSENLKIFYATLLGDPIFAVRRTAPVILPLIASRYGLKWTIKNIIPFFKMFTKDTRYLYRYIPLFGIDELINPSVLTTVKYLNPQTYKSNTDVLYKINYLTKKLTQKLDEKTYKDILSLSSSIDDFKNDNVFLYAGDTITALKETCSQHLFASSNEDWYLIELIILIYTDFLDIILNLFDDKIVNVQVRAIFTLNQIKKFAHGIGKELKEEWVVEQLKTLAEDAIKGFDAEMEKEISEKHIIDDRDDTSFIETIFTSNELNIPDIKIQYTEVDTIEFADADVTTKNDNNDDDKTEESNELNTDIEDTSINNSNNNTISNEETIDTSLAEDNCNANNDGNPVEKSGNDKESEND